MGDEESGEKAGGTTPADARQAAVQPSVQELRRRKAKGMLGKIPVIGRAFREKNPQTPVQPASKPPAQPPAQTSPTPAQPAENTTETAGQDAPPEPVKKDSPEPAKPAQSEAAPAEKAPAEPGQQATQGQAAAGDSQAPGANAAPSPPASPTPQPAHAPPPQGKKRSRKKILLIAFAVLFIGAVLVVAGLAFVGGVGGFMLFKSGGGETASASMDVSSEDCSAPYIRHGTGCCLDQNSNSICDQDETGMDDGSGSITPTTILPAPTTTIAASPTTTLTSAPTTTTPKPIPSGDIICYKDEDCGTSMQQCRDPFCKGGSVYRRCKTDLCDFPGTKAARCYRDFKDILIDECGSNEVCREGRLSCEVKTVTCQYPGKTAPEDASIIDITSEYGEKIQGYQFKIRSKATDGRGCIQKIYLYTKKPGGLEATTELTWDDDGYFESDDIEAGLLNVISDDEARIWLEFACTTTAQIPGGADLMTVTKNTKIPIEENTDYSIELNDVLYSDGCPFALKMELRKNGRNYKTIAPSWTKETKVDGISFGLHKIIDDDEAIIWVIT